jgi:hypothetical protein
VVISGYADRGISFEAMKYFHPAFTLDANWGHISKCIILGFSYFKMQEVEATMYNTILNRTSCYENCSFRTRQCMRCIVK